MKKVVKITESDIQRIVKKIINESPMLVDKVSLGDFTTPEIMDVVLSQPTYSRKQALEKAPSEPGLYFWFITPEGAKLWEDIITTLTGKQESIGYCTINDQGNILVYVGKAESSILDRIEWHTDNKSKIAFPNVKSGTDSSMRSKIILALIDSQTGRYTPENLERYLNFLDENISFTFLTKSQMEEFNNNQSLGNIVKDIESQFINNCVLYFNDRGVPKILTPYTIKPKWKPEKNKINRINKRVSF